MENNTPRYKGNETQMNYYTQLPFNPILNQGEYVQDDYTFESIHNHNYQNFQHPYRHQNSLPFESHSMYGDYGYENNINSYVYGMHTLVPPYLDNYQNTVEHINYDSPYYNDANTTRPPYSQYNQSSPRQFSIYRPSEPMQHEYYTEMNYQNMGSNTHGYSQSSGMPTLPDVPSYYSPHSSTQNLNHSHFCSNQARPTFLLNRLESPQIYRSGETLRDAVLNSNKPKSSLIVSYNSNVQKSFDSKDVPLLMGMNFKVSHANVNTSSQLPSISSTSSQNVKSFEDLQINSKDFPALSASTPSIKNSQIKHQNSEEPIGKRRTISSSQGMTVKPKVSSSIPDISQFLLTYTSLSTSKQEGTVFGLSELSKSLSKNTVVGCSENSMKNEIPLIPIVSDRKPVKCTEQDYPVPYEYLIYQSIREKIAKISCKLFNDDTLLFIYYNEDDDMIKLSAIAHLYARKWRYHVGSKLWIKTVQNYNSGDTYTFFDYVRWECVTSDKFIDPKQFEENVYNKYLNYEASVVIVQNNLLNSISSQTKNTNNNETTMISANLVNQT